MGWKDSTKIKITITIITIIVNIIIYIYIYILNNVSLVGIVKYAHGLYMHII